MLLFFFLLCWWISSFSNTVKMTKLRYLNLLMVTDEATSVTSMACKLQMLRGWSFTPSCCQNVDWRQCVEMLCSYPSLVPTSLFNLAPRRKAAEVLAWIIPLSPCLSSIFSPTWGVLQTLHHSKDHSNLQEVVLLQGSIPWEYTVCSKHLMVVTIPVP